MNRATPRTRRGAVGLPHAAYPDDATVARMIWWGSRRIRHPETMRSPRRGDGPRRVFGMQESLPQLRIGEPVISREPEDVFRTRAQLLEHDRTRRVGIL